MLQCVMKSRIKYLYLFAFIFLCNGIYAQEYKIREVIELNNDLAARTKSKNDSNGKACALVRVDVPSVNSIRFDSSIVGEPEFLPGEYNVYIPEDSKRLAFQANGSNYTIDFPQYDISIEGKKCYRVVLSKESQDTQPVSHTIISANYDNAVVMIDGIPVGQLPLAIDNISPGRHTLSVPNTFGVTMRDTVINFSSVNRITLTLHKENKQNVYVDMATSGGDTSGWSYVFGTNVKERNGRMGIEDYAGNILVPFEYDYIYPEIQNGYYVVNKNGKSGLYEPGKGLVVPCIYDGIVTTMSYTHDSYMPVCIDEKWGVISPNGEQVVPIEYGNYPHCDKEVIRVEKDGYGYGLFSYDGRCIVSPKYNFINGFVNGYALFSTYNRLTGFVDKNGNETILPSKYGVDYWAGWGGTVYSSGLFAIKDKDNRKYGYIDEKLNLVIPTKYEPIDHDEIPNFNQGIVLLKINDDEVILNNKGEIVLSKIEGGYKDIQIVRQWDSGRFGSRHATDDLDDNTFIQVINNEYKLGLMNVQGKTIVPCNYTLRNIEARHSFLSNYYSNQDIDIDAKVLREISDSANNYIQWFTDNNENIFVLRNKNSLDVVNEQQQILFSLPLSLSVVNISDGFVMIKDNETKSYGYLNMKGEILANCIYGYVSNTDMVNEDKEDKEGIYDITDILEDHQISEGLAIISVGDRFGFIDNKGNVRVPLIYTAVTPFANGIAFVRDQKGNWKKILKKDL